MKACASHPADRVELRRKPAVGGGVHFVLQCGLCGQQVGRPVPLHRVPDPVNVKRWNARLARRAHPGSVKRGYQARFDRADWKKLRRLVLERDRYLCQRCGERADEVHHLTYERFGHERIADLAASCLECNQKERCDRIARQVLG